ncbi:hypothetical protein C8F01DRAFT_1254018 [Mycena amicta]|nr:hypothetical protein C8F01DRAFT_1254018 [Mycena amicta]
MKTLTQKNIATSPKRQGKSKSAPAPDSLKELVLGRTKRKRVVKLVDPAEKKNEKGWAKGVIEDEILQKHLGGFAEAREKGPQAERNFLKNVLNEFFYCVPWNLKKGEQPPLPLPRWTVDTVVDDDELSDEDKRLKAQFVKQMKPKIRRWFIYRVDSVRGAANPGDDVWTVLLAMATNLHPPHKARQGYQQYMHEAYAVSIDPTVQREWSANGDAANGEAPTTSPSPAFRAKIARRLFHELEPDIQQAYRDRAKAESAAKRTEYQAMLRAWPGKTPQDRQNAIDNLGLHVFFMAGGPIPQYGGALRTVHLAYGVNRAAVPVSFPNHNKDRFQQQVLGTMKDYLKTAFTPEQCAAAALPREDQITPPTTSAPTDDPMDPVAPLDFQPVDLDPAPGGVAITAASLLSVMTMDDDGVGAVPTYEDDEDEDDEDDEDEDDEEEDADAALEKARAATRQREATIAANKKLLASFGLGLDPITGKPATAKPPPKKRKEKAKEESVRPVPRRVTKASAETSVAGTSGSSIAPTTATPLNLATPPNPANSPNPDNSPNPATPPITPIPDPTAVAAPDPRATPPANPSSQKSTNGAQMEVDGEDGEGENRTADSKLAGGDEDRMDVDSDERDQSILALKRRVEPDESGEKGWLLNVLDELAGVRLGDEFVGLVESLVDLERGYGFRNGLGRLATKSRPQQVADWIQNYRKATPAKCGVRNVDAYSKQWWAWWRANQPGWRTYDEGGRPTRDGTAMSGVKWEKLVVPGQNGVSSFAAALYWWGCREKEEGPYSQDWREAVEDVTWVFRGLELAEESTGIDLTILDISTLEHFSTADLSTSTEDISTPTKDISILMDISTEDISTLMDISTEDISTLMDISTEDISTTSEDISIPMDISSVEKSTLWASPLWISPCMDISTIDVCG